MNKTEFAGLTWAISFSTFWTIMRPITGPCDSKAA